MHASMHTPSLSSPTGPADLSSFPDTLRFLALLSSLDAPGAPQADLPEHRAAVGLFRWDDEVVVTRAPGRLDVMGGIADYSGSLVLQVGVPGKQWMCRGGRE